MASRSCRMKSEIKCLQFIYNYWMILHIYIYLEIWFILKTSSNLSRFPECMGTWKPCTDHLLMWHPFWAQCFAMKWEINWSQTIPKEFWWNSGVSFQNNPWKLDLFISVPCASVESQWPSMEHVEFIAPSQGGCFAPSCQCSTPNVRQREVSPWAQLWCMCCLVTNKLLKTSQAKPAKIVGFYRTFALETRNSTNSVTNGDKWWWEKTSEINTYHLITSYMNHISHKIPTHRNKLRNFGQHHMHYDPKKSFPACLVWCILDLDCLWTKLPIIWILGKQQILCQENPGWTAF